MTMGDLSKTCQDSLAAILTFEHDHSVVDYQRHVLRELRRAFDADAACFFVYQDDEGEDQSPFSFDVQTEHNVRIDYDAFVAENLDAATGPLYEEYYLKLDPFAQALSDMGPAITPLATAGKDLLAPGTRWKETEFYADFMRPRNVHHLMCLRLVDGLRVSGLISLYRSARRRGFNNHELTQAQVFSPALTNGLARAQISSRLTGYQQLIEGFDQIGKTQGLLVLDDNLCWQAISPTLEGWLRDGSPEERQRFHRQLVQKVNALCAAAPVSSRPMDNRHMDIVRDTSGRLLRLSRMMPHQHDTGAPTLVVVEPLERNSAVTQNARRYNLSRRQHQVAQMLVDGLSAAEVADKLCLSRATVNNHIRALYAKAGVGARGKFIHAMTATQAASTGTLGTTPADYHR